jgi:type I restriction enzyme S subunit
MKQTLGQIASVTMGQSPSSNFYNNEQLGLPFLQGCTTFGRLYPTYDTWTTFYNKEALPGDVLFTVRAPVGDVNLCRDHIAIGRGLASIRATTVLPRYLFYILEANKSKFQSASSGTIYQSINRDKLANMELDVHSPSEQQHIVGTRRQV